jgi:hypothetical protein
MGAIGEQVVEAVPGTGPPAEPGVLRRLRMQVAEGIDQTVGGEGAVEVILPGAEVGVRRNVTGLDHVEIPGTTTGTPSAANPATSGSNAVTAAWNALLSTLCRSCAPREGTYNPAALQQDPAVVPDDGADDELGDAVHACHVDQVAQPGMGGHARHGSNSSW